MSVEELKQEITEFLVQEARSCSMDYGCVTIECGEGEWPWKR